MLHGTLAGTGKSSIASIAVQQIRHQAESQVAFLYLSYRESPSVENLLGCVAGQLLRQTNNSPCELLVNRMSSPPGVKQLTDLLSKLASASTFLVVDALDEFDTSQSETLVGILQGTKANLFVTSRNKPAQGFEELEVEAHEEDIRHYIQERCKQNNRLIKMIERDASLEQDIKDAITTKAAGIFLLAYFHVEAVLGLQVLTASEVRKALKELPSRRDSMYEKTLERIKAQDKARSTHAMRTIGWIVHAHKPLTIQELRHALLIQKINDSNNDSKVDIFLDHGALLQDTDILEFCHGLVEVDKKTTAVRLIHFSALEYFNSATVREKEFPTFYSEMALACATYLCLTRLEFPKEKTDEYFHDQNSYREEFIEYQSLVKGRSSQELESKYSMPHSIVRLSENQIPRYSNGRGVSKQLSVVIKYLLYPFATHAAEYITTYLRATSESSRSNVENQLQILLENLPKRLFYLYFKDPELAQYKNRSAPFCAASIRSAKLFNHFSDQSHENLLKQLFYSHLKDPEVVEYKDPKVADYKDPSTLFCAASIGSAKLFRYFYYQGYDGKNRSVSTDMAFIEASERGFLDVVKSCVAFGVMSDLTNTRIYSAMCGAASARNFEVLSYLISTLQNVWESQKQLEDAASSNNGMGLVCKILDWIADRFNSFKDTTDPDPSSSTNEEIYNLDGYLKLLWACQKGDAASIPSLIKELPVLYTGPNLSVESAAFQLSMQIVTACTRTFKEHQHIAILRKSRMELKTF
ncbi:uncharacterized protein BKA78DRAFT_158408 [Phyllosticta capitalensis]|uniref:uncharacterized protein n=1 Tax=Phyllosticta capitalensis TaxID=121624 RepID=UPI00313099A1